MASKKFSDLLKRAGFLLYLAGNSIWYFFRHTVSGRLIIFVGIVAIAGFFLVSPIFSGQPASAITPQTLLIPNGANFKQITDSLSSKGLLEHPRLFRLLARVTGKDRAIKAGLFEIPAGLSTWDLLYFMDVAPIKQIKVTMPEGLHSERIAGIFADKLEIDSSRFVQLVNDSNFVQKLVPGQTSLEGYLLPNTYVFEWKTSEETLIKFLVKRTLEIFEADSVQQRLADMKMNMHQIITLAAIVEGEAVVDSERTTIASLYLNRIRIGMPLQADPTIQFAIPGPPRRLLFKDLKYDSPYNTYKYRGLPPGPINNPGRASIIATLFPAKSPYLYMVAYGDGTHKFSKTLKEHNYWHQRFNEVRRKVRRQRQN